MTVVGARPEFIQTALVSRVLRQRHTEILVHSGQHYHYNMSDVFFAELGLPDPEYNLGVGSGSHAQQMGQIMMRLEPIMLAEKPDWVLVYGDTNTTLAASMVAAKLHIPLAHIEAGLRSFDRTMPEEINRIVTDHISDLLFAPTATAVKNLSTEGIVNGVQQVGDVRVDIVAEFIQQPEDGTFWQKIGLSEGESFALATIHRAANTDDIVRLCSIVEALNTLDLKVVLPIHPRLHKMMDIARLAFGNNVQVIEPVGFKELLRLLRCCEIVITDSGGLQKEAYLLHKPTITVRDSTEWVETVSAGWNRLCEPVLNEFKAAIAQARKNRPETHPDFYGSPGVCERICTALENAFLTRPGP